MAAATAIGQLLCILSWLAMVAATLGGLPETVTQGHAAHQHPVAVLGGWKGIVAVAVPLGLLGLAIETLVAFGLARYLERVLPGLLPRPRTGTITT